MNRFTGEYTPEWATIAARVKDEAGWRCRIDTVGRIERKGTMTADELRSKYTMAYKIIRAERAMRWRVFAPGHLRHEEKIAEIDKLMEILTAFKDELKVHVGDIEQAALFDVPAKVEYP